MNEAIELHDSVLDSVEIEDGILILSLRPACVHTSNGVPGVDAGFCFVQDMAIEFDGYELVGNPGMLPADIIRGVFELDEREFPNMIHLPCAVEKAVKLTLNLWPDGRRIAVWATNMRVKRLSEANHMEEFKP